MKKNRNLLSNLEKQYKREQDLQETVEVWLDLQTDLKKIRICDAYHSGYSDFFVCVNGIFVILELKAEDGTPSATQIEFIDDMRKVGAIGGICRSLTEVINYIEQARMLAKGVQNA